MRFFIWKKDVELEKHYIFYRYLSKKLIKKTKELVNVTIDYDSERDNFVIWTDIDAVLSSLKID